MDLTPDLCDQFGESLQVLTPGLRSFGGRSHFIAQAVTVKAFEDNSLVREWVAKPGHGKVLVVDGGASMRHAMLGDLLAAKAVDNGWEAIVISGCIRDCVAIGQMDIAVFALGTHPMKTEKLGAGQSNIRIRIQDVWIEPDHYLAGDPNGLVYSDQPLAS